MLFDFVNWVNNTYPSVALREGTFLFPVIETIHILGLGVSVGVIMWLDLRLLGLAMRHQSVTQMVEQLERWAIVGFVVMFVSGVLLFFSEPLKCYSAGAFRLKALVTRHPDAGLQRQIATGLNHTSRISLKDQIRWMRDNEGSVPVLL